MSSEETARAIGGPFPMNATIRNPFEESRYSPLDSAPLKLAPSASISGDPNVKVCFTEAELATKCPTILIKPKPKPPASNVCVGYETVTPGDGYERDYGDEEGGGFAPMIPENQIEPYYFGNSPSQGSLPLKENTTTTIKESNLAITLLPRNAQAISSIKLGTKEFLNTPSAMFSTVAIDVPKNTTDKLTRVDEAGNKNPTKTTSRVLKVAANKNSAFTSVQASYYLPPGSIISGKRVSQKSTLSNTIISKRISIAPNKVVRYTTGISIEYPFKSARFNMPIYKLKPEFKKIVVYKKSTNEWWTPSQSKIHLGDDHRAFIFTTTDHKVAMGVRPIDFPKPKNFGSKFYNSYETHIVRGTTMINVASTLVVGRRGGMASKLWAPSGTYSSTCDYIFGTFAEVQKILNNVFKGSNGGKCPTVCPPKPPSGTKIIPGTITSVTDANKFVVKYENKSTNSVISTKVTKAKHGFKSNEPVNVTVDAQTWVVKNVTKRGTGKPTVKPTAPAGTIIIAAKVTAVPNANKVSLQYTKPNKKLTKVTVTKNKHGMKVGEAVDVVARNKDPYAFVAVYKKGAIKPAPKPATKPTAPAGTIVISAKVTAVPNANKVSLQYTKPNKKLTKVTVTKNKHGMKVGEAVDVVARNKDPYAFVAVYKKGAIKPAPKPAPKPTPKPTDTVKLNAKVVAVPNANKVSIQYTKPDKKNRKTHNKQEESSDEEGRERDRCYSQKGSLCIYIRE
ncbi:hypothetical protein PBCVIL52s1_077R [Paramecium bursaria Chlorella virus IL-5-2s1]|nr:hypothetical protein PBCVIL52s1_077R [Paramecium bursaria Chlorella virus IL-5-2s1]